MDLGQPGHVELESRGVDHRLGEIVGRVEELHGIGQEDRALHADVAEAAGLVRDAVVEHDARDGLVRRVEELMRVAVDDDHPASVGVGGRRGERAVAALLTHDRGKVRATAVHADGLPHAMPPAPRCFSLHDLPDDETYRK